MCTFFLTCARVPWQLKVGCSWRERHWTLDAVEKISVLGP